MPAQKLKSKTRAGSKQIKVYGEPGSPFARLSENIGLPQEVKDTLNCQRALYNPAGLQRNVNKAVLRLRLAQTNRLKTQKQL
jgi:hypothetical protein